MTRKETANARRVQWVLETGALAKPISEQLIAQEVGLSDVKAKHFQRDLDAINRLRIRGWLTDRQAQGARNRLCHALAKVVE